MTDLGTFVRDARLTAADAEWTTNEPGGASGCHWRVGRNDLTH
jgi:hypothetical protein